jgi:hypothetical protein
MHLIVCTTYTAKISHSKDALLSKVSVAYDSKHERRIHTSTCLFRNYQLMQLMEGASPMQRSGPPPKGMYRKELAISDGTRVSAGKRSGLKVCGSSQWSSFLHDTCKSASSKIVNGKGAH